MYGLQSDGVLIVDRSDAEELFQRLGCVNTKQWDNDTLVHRLQRASCFVDQDGAVGDLQPLLDAIKTLGNNGMIILRKNKPSSIPTIPFLEKEIARKLGKKRIRRHKKRFRGEPFSFEKCHIPSGAVLELKKDPSITCVVVGDPYMVDFKDGSSTTGGKENSFTSRTRELLNVRDTTYLSPMHYWMYKGVLLKRYYQKYQGKDAGKDEEVQESGDGGIAAESEVSSS